ncbi:sterol desaturase family protein [Vibrio sp. F74]|uniref:sterol desaturase family protein n=1 Tax=Vibrio sp. F74 TaxID=700020 RepID=UPI0035F5A7CB
MKDPEIIRLAFFVSAFGLFAIWEWLKPRKALTQKKSIRWINNLSLVISNNVVLAVIMPILAFQAAQFSEAESFGLFHLIDLPFWLTVVLSVVILDMAIYLQHMLFHRVPLLWRLHRVHHADQDIDLTTGSRFHPIEIVLSAWIKIGCVMLLGVPAIAVVIFEVILNVSAMFNHSNARMPLALDRWLRRVVVTPDMHRVHHSIVAKETHSNFGFFLSIWDRFFKTYISQPTGGHGGCVIGVPEFREPREQYLDKMLTQPFRV